MVAARAFSNLLEILGGQAIEVTRETKHWNHYSLRFRTPAGQLPANYVYLSSECPLAAATPSNLAFWRSQGRYTVVPTTSSRLANNLSRTANTFGAASATTPRDLLIDNILKPINIGSNPLDDFQYFIEPEITISDDNSTDNQSVPALTHIATSLINGETDGAEVLVAPAGQGKTTLCRQLAAQIRARHPHVIPVLVESRQWQSLIDLTLPNVLNAALLEIAPDAISLTNRRVFQALVREKLLIPIFDGFDELSLHPGAETSAATLLTDLLTLIGSSSARVLITARETFWEKHVGLFSPDTLKKIHRLNLQGFSNQQRKQFFQKRLSLPQERDIANRLSREVGSRLYQEALDQPEQQADRASGVPLMLELIALYVDGNPKATFFPETHDPLGPLLESVCERENVRQQLDISSQQQMSVFETLFRDYQNDIPRDELGLYVEVLVPGVSPDAIDRFESHAFFSPTQGNFVAPRFETLRVYFLARWLAAQLELSVGKRLDENAEIILARHATGASDIFDYLVRRFSREGKERTSATISHAVRMVRGRPNWEGASSALFHLSQRLAQTLGKERKEKTVMVMEFMMGIKGKDRQIQNVAVRGQISGLDFSGIQFGECKFRNATFHNCNFDEETSFVKSRFLGGLSFTNCSGEGSAQIDMTSCSLSEAAALAWDERRGHGSRGRGAKEKLAKEALREILRKFTKGGRFESIKYADRNSGPISKNPFKGEVWTALQKAGIVESHKISGVPDGGMNVVKNSNVMHEVRNYVDNAAMGNRLREALDDVLGRSTTD